MSAVLAILATPGLEVEEADIILQAIVWYEQENVDFIDAYHAAWMFSRELSVAHTVDRRHFSRFEHVVANVPERLDLRE